MARQGMFSKAKNLALLGLAFADAIRWVIQGQWGQAVYDYSGGFAGNPQTGSGGTANIDIAAASRAYGPVLAAFVLGYAANELMKKFPVRG